MYEKIDNYINKLLSSKPETPLWNIESIKLNRKPSWNYIDGCMINSFIELYKTTKDDKYLNFVINFINYYVDTDGTILNYDSSKFVLDDICESRVLFDLYEFTKDEKYLKAIENTYEQIKKQPRTKDGSFWHKKIYHDQIWLDGLYMVNPFYAKYLILKNNNNFDDILLQFKNVRKFMFDEEKQLYYHAYDASKTLFWANKETGLSQNFWLRAIGWYIVALIDTIEIIGDKNKEATKELSSLFVEAINGILKYKDEASNMFFDLPYLKNIKGNYLETSGSSMISYSILKGARLGILENSFVSIGEKIFEGISNKYLTIKENGDLNLGGIVLVSGLGPEDNLRRDGTVEYYFSEPVVENDAKGVAPFIMAYSELIKAK